MLLVVDDNVTKLYIKVRLLRQAGFQVAEARTGSEAITAVKALKPRLVILDIKLPDINGYEVCRQIKADPATASTMVLQTSATYVRPDDTAQALEAGADGCLTEPAEPVVLLASVRALLRLHEALHAASETNTTLRKLIGASPTAIIALDGHGRVTTWNPAAEKIFGWTESDVLGKNSPIQPSGHSGVATNLFSTPIPEHETRRTIKSGSVVEVILSGTPFQAKDNSAGLLIMCTDIAGRKFAERQREESFARERIAREEAEAANRAKDDFLAVLSHELRSPLNAILSWSSLLQSGNLPPERVSQAIGAIQRNSLVQTQLINDLLDISRIIAGKLRIEARPVNLSTVVEAAFESIRPTADLKKIEIIWRLDSAEPVFGDPARLQQIVRNLVSNAVKFTPEHGAVTIELRQTESASEIVIKDNGVGIDADLLPHIFERFLQGDSTATRKETGLGLGLAIARHLAELHGGTLTVESPGPGKGSTFTLSLPLGEPELRAISKADAPAATIQHTQSIDQPLGGLDILIVDDEQDSREAFALYLEQNGARVTSASSARGALAELQRVTPDVMLSDIGMPGEDGFELIRKVRERETERKRKIHAIAVTGYVSGDDRKRALAEGYDMYLAKPVDLQELLDILGRVRRRKPAGR